MTHTRCCWVLLALALTATSTEAQVFISGNGFSANYSRVSRRGNLSSAVSGFHACGFAFGPIYGYPSPYHGHRVSRVTVFYSPPPPIVIAIPVPVPEPRLNLGRRDDPEPLPPDPPLPGRNAGVFRPLEADNRARAERPVMPAVPEVPKRAEVEVPRPRAKPDVRPRLETLVEKGRAAFAAEEYGRALDFFGRAVEAAPQDALAQFLLSQAYLALGKYGEAVDAIRAGMALHRDWPAAGFQPWELYGPNARDYDENIDRLQDALTRRPDDPVLLFLLGHQLWFEGRQAEARLLFQRARPRFAKPEVIDRFLVGVPGVPVVRGKGT